MAAGDRGRQSRKSRAALLGAFNALVVERRYADIRIADVIRRADVGRSTFYEHFRNKEALLLHSLAGVLAVMAGAVDDDCEPEHLRLLLDHFSEHGALARGLLSGPAGPQVVAALAGLIRQRLVEMQQRLGLAPLIPLDLAAAQLAQAQLGLVHAWLSRGAAFPSGNLAAAMRRSAAAAARALFS